MFRRNGSDMLEVGDLFERLVYDGLDERLVYDGSDERLAVDGLYSYREEFCPIYC